MSTYRTTINTYVILLAATWLTLTGYAQAHSLMPANMSIEERQEMMTVIQQLQACFAKIDTDAITMLQKQSNAFASELRSLCVNNRREEAAEKTQAFYDKIMKDGSMKQAKACGDKIPKSFISYLSTPLNLSQFEKHEGQHVCDQEIMPVDQFSGHQH